MLNIQDFIQAEEIHVQTETLHSIAKHLTEILAQCTDVTVDFVKFVQDCCEPLHYLLKREQNLTDYIRSIKQLLNKKHRQIPRVNVRLLVDMLLSNSDPFLRSNLTCLLSKQNPVPMLQPELEQEISSKRFVPELIYVWDYSQPTLVSFNIGTC